MSLAVHQTWIIFATLFLTICSVLLLLFRHYLPWAFKYNEAFLSLFGIESDHSSWFQYLFSWLIGTCMATVVLTLIVNINEAIFIVTGLGGIPFDPVIVPLAFGGIILAILLIAVALIPLMVMPLAPASALGILLLLHRYGIPYDFFYLPSLLTVFIYFAAIAVGFVGAFLALYLLIRTYLAAPLLNRLQTQSESSSITQEDNVSTPSE